MATFHPMRSCNRSVSFTVPSATRLARTCPVKALVNEPTRSNVCRSGGFPDPSEVSPKPKTAVLPSRTTPITRAGTWLCRKSTCPVNSVVSARSLSSAQPLAAKRMNSIPMLARRQISPRFARLTGHPNPHSKSYIEQTTVQKPRQGGERDLIGQRLPDRSVDGDASGLDQDGILGDLVFHHFVELLGRREHRLGPELRKGVDHPV